MLTIPYIDTPSLASFQSIGLINLGLNQTHFVPVEQSGDRALSPYCPSAESIWRRVRPCSFIHTLSNLCSCILGNEPQDCIPNPQIEITPSKVVFKSFNEKTGLSIANGKVVLISPPFIGFHEETTSPVFLNWPQTASFKKLERTLNLAAKLKVPYFSYIARDMVNVSEADLEYFNKILEP